MFNPTKYDVESSTFSVADSGITGALRAIEDAASIAPSQIVRITMHGSNGKTVQTAGPAMALARKLHGIID